MNRMSFVAWNVLPDFAPNLLKLSHFKKDIYDLVMERAESLEENWDRLTPRQLSKQMGILCHFMADFFCYAHSETFDGSKVGHLMYEFCMQFFGYRRRHMLHAADLISKAAELNHSAALYEQINELHEKYMGDAQSYGNDFIYSLTACVSLMMEMVDCRELVNVA